MQSFDRFRMKGKRLRMKVLVGEDRLEDQDGVALGCPIDFDIRRPYYAAILCGHVAQLGPNRLGSSGHGRCREEDMATDKKMELEILYCWD